MKPIVKAWLLLGAVLIFFQIFIGGVTRLTGSGLSITKWEIVTGTIPPMNQEQWMEEFELYKETPQYQKINQGMTLRSFKFIYFWEYFHRLWARMMGFIFLIPFVYFLTKGWLPKKTVRQLLLLVGMTAVVATFGWIMVASGLNDRPWVSAYKLTWHLSLALIVYGYMWWIVFGAWYPNNRGRSQLQSKPIKIFLGILIVQIMLGGIMSGAKAGLFFPTWPDMQGELIPSLLFQGENWRWENFMAYDKNVFFPALVQFVHRMTAYVLLAYGIVVGRRFIQAGNSLDVASGITVLSLLVLQVILGIITVLSCYGTIPVSWGVLHQAVAVLLLTATLWTLYITQRVK